MQVMDLLAEGHRILDGYQTMARLLGGPLQPAQPAQPEGELAINPYGDMEIPTALVRLSHAYQTWNRDIRGVEHTAVTGVNSQIHLFYDSLARHIHQYAGQEGHWDYAKYLNAVLGPDCVAGFADQDPDGVEQLVHDLHHHGAVRAQERGVHLALFLDPKTQTLRHTTQVGYDTWWAQMDSVFHPNGDFTLTRVDKGDQPASIIATRINNTFFAEIINDSEFYEGPLLRKEGRVYKSEPSFWPSGKYTFDPDVDPDGIYLKRLHGEELIHSGNLAAALRSIPDIEQEND